MDILDKFSNHLKNILINAYNLAEQQKDTFIRPEHILFCLTKEKGSLGCELLAGFNVSSDDIKHFIKPQNPPKIVLNPQISPETKSLIEKMLVTANIFEHQFVGTEHLISAFMQMEKSILMILLIKKKINIKSLNSQLKNILKSGNKYSEIIFAFDSYNLNKEQEITPSEDYMPFSPMQTPVKDALKAFTVDLTEKSIQTRIDPLIGREYEVQRLVQILGRKTKNNPILLGDAGVGKTAIIEGLAKKIFSNDVPDSLLNKKIFSLDLGAVIAGTIYRGEFEARIKQIIDTMKKEKDVILFIDEIHNIMGAGSSNGTLDAANILKPALARGELRCIGATTMDEYKQHIEKDPALERRFQPIIVFEPSTEKTKQILWGIKSNYEQFHNVKILDEAIISSVELADKYIQDKYFPDKAIDLIDEASSKVKISQTGNSQAVRLKELEKKLFETVSQKQEAVISEEFEKALKLKNQEKSIKQEIELCKKISLNDSNKTKGIVSQKEIFEIISGITNIPLEKLTQRSKDKVLSLEKSLNKKIIGQKQAVKSVYNRLIRSFANINYPHQPLASFLFIGPSGSGKTEMAKVLAKELFDSSDALIRVDMSEFSESFNISKLIGSPAGYVGYRETNRFTDLVKKRPYSLILLDEIEKAHPNILNLLLQILDEGFITDAIGRKINFKNTVIVMTSNLGASQLQNIKPIGFGSENKKNRHQEYQEKVLATVKKHFAPEFLNRINDVIVFNDLKENDLKQILKLKIKELNDRLQSQNIFINPDIILMDYLAQKAVDKKQGARSVNSLIEEYIENPLALEILKEKISPNSKIKIFLKKGLITFKTHA